MDTEITIIGAGVIGLAIAARVSSKHSPVLVVEKHSKFGQETSSRNSEVIHSGIYYPIHSLKAEFCREGRTMLYAYCDENNIGYNKCGKLIVATCRDEMGKLQQIQETARRNHVTDGTLLNRTEVISLEPNLQASSGLFFPSSGIIDSHALMHQLETDAINNGAEFAYGNEVIEIKKHGKGYLIEVAEPDGNHFTFTSRILINAGGLQAETISRMAGLYLERYKTYFWKGEYFNLANGKHKLVSRLIYPLPEKHNTGLGIHTTPDLGGRVRLGPNSIYLQDGKPDYTIDPNHSVDFFESAVRFLPFLELQDLVPDQVGIRPKLQKPGDTVRDFEIREEGKNGYPGLINLIGIESPGLTACLSIGKYVQSVIDKI